MKDVKIFDAIREAFPFFVSPRTNKECQDWQNDSKAFRLPYQEARIDRDDCWLRHLEVSISAMKEYVQTGDCEFYFAEVPTPAGYADSDDTSQKLSKFESVIDVFANRVSESKKEAYTNILR